MLIFAISYVNTIHIATHTGVYKYAVRWRYIRIDGVDVGDSLLLDNNDPIIDMALCY
jgi:hypothetical protein